MLADKGVTMRTKRTPAPIARARKLGAKKGAACVDCQYLPGGGRDTMRNPAVAAAALLAAWEDGDLEVSCFDPPDWLSGEWADEPTPRDVAADCGITERSSYFDDVVAAYIEAADQAYIDGICAHLRHVAKGGES